MRPEWEAGSVAYRTQQFDPPEPPRNPWPWWLRAALYGGITAAALVGASGIVRAWPYAESNFPRMAVEPPTQDCLAVIRIYNLNGHYRATETLQTAAGTVSIHYSTVGAHRRGDDDKITVESLPVDVFARPMEAAIPDGETLTVCLFEYIGG